MFRRRVDPLVNITRVKGKHIDAIRDMHLSRNYDSMHSITMEELPKIGFISYSNSEYQYVAAGFLRMVEGGYAQIDSLVSNEKLSPELRHEGLKLVVDSLIETAKSLKLKGIYALTLHSDILERAVVTGFRVLDHKVITLSL